MNIGAVYMEMKDYEQAIMAYVMNMCIARGTAVMHLAWATIAARHSRNSIAGCGLCPQE